MKNKLSLFLLTAILALSLPLTGCGGTDGGNETSSASDSGSSAEESTSEPEKVYPEYEIDLGGAEFNICYFDAVKACGWLSDIPCDVDAESETGDNLSDTVYKRNRKIEEMYNLKIKAHQETMDVYTNLVKSVMSQSGEYDAAFVKQQGLEKALTSGALMQLDDLLDFSMPWWDEKSLEGLSICGKTYAISGDVTFMDKLCDIVIFFNKQMAEDFNLGDIYQLVVDKKWTFDELKRMCSLVSADLNEDGKADKGDRFGFSGQNDASYELFQSAGERFCTLDADGVPYQSNNSERAIDVMMKVYEFMNDKPNFFNRQTENLSVADTINMFKENRVLFLMRPLQTLFELRAMEADFGIIPTPLMDETQTEYHTSIGFTVSNVVTIPSDAKDAKISAQVLDTLSAESYYSVNDVFYDMVLGTKLTRDDNSTENLQIILDSCVYDPGCIYGFGSMAADFMKVGKADKVASDVAKYTTRVQAGIEKLIELINEE